MNKKVRNVMFTLLITITIIAVGVVVFILNDQQKTLADGERTIEDMIEDSFETKEITTDLMDGNFVRISFRVVTDNEDTKKVLKSDFRVENLIIKELSTKKEENLRTGLSELEKTIKDKLNGLLSEGEVTHVYTTSKILQ